MRDVAGTLSVFLRVVEGTWVVVGRDGKRTKSESESLKLVVVLVAGVGSRGEWG